MEWEMEVRLKHVFNLKNYDYFIMAMSNEDIYVYMKPYERFVMACAPIGEFIFNEKVLDLTHESMYTSYKYQKDLLENGYILIDEDYKSSGFVFHDREQAVKYLQNTPDTDTLKIVKIK
jgi:hypothetical protein